MHTGLLSGKHGEKLTASWHGPYSPSWGGSDSWRSLKTCWLEIKGPWRERGPSEWKVCQTRVFGPRFRSRWENRRGLEGSQLGWSVFLFRLQVSCSSTVDALLTGPFMRILQGVALSLLSVWHEVKEVRLLKESRCHFNNIYETHWGALYVSSVSTRRVNLYRWSFYNE